MITERQAYVFQRKFIERLGVGFQLAELVSALPNVAFFVKDLKSRFVWANETTLRIFNLQHEWQMLGRADTDFLPLDVSSGYVQEDRRVMHTGRPLTHYTQMVPNVNGPLCWYVVSKFPLRDARGEICGVAIVMYEVVEVAGVSEPLKRLEPALRHLRTNFRQQITVEELAQLVNLSPSQFSREFRRIVGDSPLRYLIRQRIHTACCELVSTSHTIGRIAIDCGFYDQSAFTRAFRQQVGHTPASYRQKHALSAPKGAQSGKG